MKKRIFAGIAAVAVAATCAVGATACGMEVNSKESWEKAWRNTASANSYILQIFESDYSEFSKPNNYTVELKYDGVHNTAYYQSSRDENIYDAEHDTYYNNRINETHYFDGSKLIDYVYNHDTWRWSTEEMSSHEEWYAINLILRYTTTPVTVNSDDGEVSGTFSELYDYADYNKSQKKYTFTSGTVAENMITYEIRFEKGYVSMIDITGADGYTRIQLFNFNSTTVTIPNSVTGKEEKPDRPGEENPGEENPGTGDSGTTPGAGTVTPPNKVTTKEEWVQAFAATFSATSYKVTGTMEVTTSQNSSYFQMQNEITGEVIYLYDGINGVLYNYMHQDITSTTTINGNTTVTPSISETESYLEVIGTNVDVYSKAISVIDSGAWSKRTENFNTAQEAADYLASQGALGSMSEDAYLASETGVAMSLEEMFDLFTYDAATETFSATLTLVAGNIKINNVKITLKFVGGMLYSSESEYTMVQSGILTTSKATNVFSDYNSTTASVPAEVKSAVQ